jgi:hypothetical protein
MLSKSVLAELAARAPVTRSIHPTRRSPATRGAFASAVLKVAVLVSWGRRYSG